MKFQLPLLLHYYLPVLEFSMFLTMIILTSNFQKNCYVDNFYYLLEFLYKSMSWFLLRSEGRTSINLGPRDHKQPCNLIFPFFVCLRKTECLSDLCLSWSIRSFFIYFANLYVCITFNIFSKPKKVYFAQK